MKVWVSKDEECLEDVHEVDGPTAITPTLETLKATKQGKLPFSNTSLTSEALKTHVFPKLGSASLISVPQLCDDDCTVVFNKKKAYISKNNKIIVTGNRNNMDGLWDIAIPVKSDTKKNHHCPDISNSFDTKNVRHHPQTSNKSGASNISSSYFIRPNRKNSSKRHSK